jgi:hypothetical protein
MEEVRKLLEEISRTATLVAVRDMDEWTVYNKELWSVWNNENDELIFGPIRGEENESGHWVVRIYRNSYGYWLCKTWVAHFGYSWDGGKVYYIGPRLPI